MDKKILGLVLAVFLCVGITAQAQDGNRRRTPVAKPSTEQFAATMAKRLKLDSKTTEWFVPVYVAYQDSLAALRKAARPAKRCADLSEAEALQAVEASLKAAEDEIALKRSFLPVFKAKLTPQQLATLYVQSLRERGHKMPQRGARPMRGQGGGQGTHDHGDAPHGNQ